MLWVWTEMPFHMCTIHHVIELHVIDGHLSSFQCLNQCCILCFCAQSVHVCIMDLIQCVHC